MPHVDIEDLRRIKLADDEVLIVRVDGKGSFAARNAVAMALQNAGLPGNRVIVTDKIVEIVAVAKPEG
jgi:hypothetical protein